MQEIFEPDYPGISVSNMSSLAQDLYLQSANDPRCIDIIQETALVHPETAAHQKTVGFLAACIAADALPSHGYTDMSLFVRGCSMHDYGKAKLVDLTGIILDKPGPLSEDEWAIVRMHPRAAFKELIERDLPKEAVLALLHHRYQERSYDSDEVVNSLLDEHKIPRHYLTDNDSALLKLGAVLATLDQTAARISNERKYRRNNGDYLKIRHDIEADLTHNGGLVRKLGLSAMVMVTLNHAFNLVNIDEASLSSE